MLLPDSLWDVTSRWLQEFGQRWESHPFVRRQRSLPAQQQCRLELSYSAVGLILHRGGFCSVLLLMRTSRCRGGSRHNQCSSSGLLLLPRCIVWLRCSLIDLGFGQRPPSTGSCCHLWIKIMEILTPDTALGSPSPLCPRPLQPYRGRSKSCCDTKPTVASRPDAGAWPPYPACACLNRKRGRPGNARSDFPLAQHVSSTFRLSAGNCALPFWDGCGKVTQVPPWQDNRPTSDRGVQRCPRGEGSSSAVLTCALCQGVRASRADFPRGTGNWHQDSPKFPV